MTSDNPGRGVAPPARWGRARRAAGTAAASRARRRVGTVLRILAALALAGGVYAGFAPGTAADAAKDAASLSPAAKEGKALFDTNCTSCHGPDAQGVAGKGPSLIGVGSASVEFQVGSGRMPMARQEAQAWRKKPHFTYDQTQQLGQYIQELGGGPQIPAGSMELTGTDEQQAAAMARGGVLFRINCASCHANAAGGGALSSGKFAPNLEPATDRQLYAAMLTGPQNMPVFGDNQLTPEQKKEIIAYVHTLKAQEPGGWGLGKLGPVTEGLAIFLLGMTALIFTTLWIAGKS
ncbi:putative ubiquinol-cytochrome c reductase cytochrome c subunit [Pilimelia anulata]|uniref:Cytochrome bc1 complex cytochrome c subunit n=1 Tax=Pilimelia anulata TaxID=53371 RepID=A0A8J3B4L3_9ACTN|nr:c-type cytochrome [Pilimelia anulata]GGJ84964.1 putative ubiquinol-cytochrome c reductase cytochrome c subunit [Pilimelia anulata]